MSNEESVDLRDKLTKDVDVADWSMLEDHFKRGALISVTEKLDLVDVGMAVAEDSVKQVEAWLASGDVYNTKPEEAEAWAVDPHKKVVEFLIVQPYVLVQKL